MPRLKKSKTHWEKRSRPKLNTTIVLRTLAYERFDHELPDLYGTRIPGLKSYRPLAVQCQSCFLLVATTPDKGIDYLIGMSFFRQNRTAIAEGDSRRLCPRCQLHHWGKHLSVIESADLRHFSLELARKIDKKLY